MITETSQDWLDHSCWQCGSEAKPDGQGRVLCGPCRAKVFGSPTSESGLTITLRLYWESHPLERCWRCMARPVDPEDAIGLCGSCHPEVERGAAQRTADDSPWTTVAGDPSR